MYIYIYILWKRWKVDQYIKMAHYFLKNRVSFIKLINPPVNGLSLAVRDGNEFELNNFSSYSAQE